MKIVSKKLLAVSMTFLLWSGDLYAGENIKLEAGFSMEEVSWIKVKGNSSIRGKAFLTLSNGTVKDCAGFNVELLPVANYSNERILKTYGNNTSGQVLLKDNPPKFTPDAEGYHEMVIKGKCDNAGNFLFEDLNSGEYYVIAFIIWANKKADGSSEKDGGAVMKKVSLSGGNHKNLLLKLN